MVGLVHDIRCAVRHLRRERGFTAVAVLILALGIGATTAVFSVCDALLLRPLPYPDQDRLVALRSTSPSRSLSDEKTSRGTLADWQVQSESFVAIAGYRWRSLDLTTGGPNVRLDGLSVTPEFFEVFGVHELIGRGFAADDRGSPSIVFGRDVWRDRFGSDPSIAGSSVDVNVLNFDRVGPTPHTVVGVAILPTRFPPLTADFQLGVAGIDDTIDFWTPELIRSTDGREAREFDVVGKLHAGVSIAEAQNEMDAIASRLAEQYAASNRDWGVSVVPLRSQLLGGASTGVLLLSVGAGIVLMIACANVGTLLLAQGVARRRDVAIRAALGAGRWRIVRQHLIEATLLALAAAVLGVILALWGMSLVRLWSPSDTPLLQGIELNSTVLGFALTAALLTAVLTGLVPAVRMSRHEGLVPAGSKGHGTTGSQQGARTVGALVAAEVALTLVLLIGTGLLVRSAFRLLDVHPGFNPRSLLTMTISLPQNKYEWNHHAAFYREVLESVRSLPFIRASAVVQGVPMREESFWTQFVVDGAESVPDADLPVARIRVVSLGYFGAMEIPIVTGRDFIESDEVGEIGRPRSVIVGEGLAKRHWPSGNVLGKRLQVQGLWMTVVGVAGDVRYTGLERNPDWELYYPQRLFPQPAITLLARTDGDPLAAAAGIQARVRQVDKDVFISDVRSMEDLFAESQALRTASTRLIAILGTIALLLVIAGVYSAISQSIAQRRLEIAIRVALGAWPRRLMTEVLKRLLFPVMAGIASGALLALGSARAIAAVLFGIRPVDLGTWTAACGLVLVCCLLAGFVPARRAAHVDPMMALRSE